MMPKRLNSGIPALLSLFAALVASSAVMAGEVSGIASVIDGDTIVIDDQRIRLAAVDAPESDQPGGQEALLVLSTIARRTPIRCEWSDTGVYQRALGTCYGQNKDGSWSKRSINQRLVEGGWAWAWPYEPHTFSKQQAIAMRKGEGIWSAPAIAPWHWRRGKRGGG